MAAGLNMRFFFSFRFQRGLTENTAHEAAGSVNLMSEIGQSVPATHPTTWADEEVKLPKMSAPSLPGVSVALLALLVLTALIGGFWLHSEVSTVLQKHRADDSQVSLTAKEMRMLKELGHWQLTAALFTATCGITLLGLGFASYRRLDAHWARLRDEQNAVWENTTRDLRTQLANKQKIETSLREQHLDLQEEFESLSRNYAQVKEQLDRLKLAEEVLSHQRRELVRSKGVLELNVQARANQLQKLQRAYELILNSAGEGICGLDTRGRISFANPAAAKMMAAEVDDMVGRPMREIFPQFMKNARFILTEIDGQSPTEVTATRQDGTTFGAEFLRTPIQEDRRIVGEVLLFKDITERKLAAETLAQKAAELARSNSELEQFAFVASHDLQEPLRKIQAFGDRLKTKCASVNLEEGRDYLDRMQNAAARMQTLIFDLLTFSRVISRTEPFVPIDLNAVARDIISDLEVRIEKTGGCVEVGDLPTIEGDGTQMRQLLLNLIGNALKFHAPGKPPVVRVASRMLSPSPPLSVDGKADSAIPLCELTIQDNGIGFDEKYLDKIFAVFQRLHGRQEYEGTGIGLAVCRRIVDRHGGTITARSQPGEGATFIITLPLQQAPKDKKGPA